MGRMEVRLNRIETNIAARFGDTESRAEAERLLYRDTILGLQAFGCDIDDPDIQQALNDDASDNEDD